jgi:hypothetical protein
MSANLTNNNKYYNLSAQSLKLNDLDVQEQLNDLQNEINNLSNENNWTNTNGGSVPVSSGLVLTTDGIEDGAVANEQIEITENSINLKNNVSVYDDLYCNKNLNIQSDASQSVSMFVDPSNNFNISNLNNSRMIFQNSSNYEFDNNIISNENVILNQGKSLTLNNDTDADNIKLYKLNGLNGNFVLDNQSGTRTTFKNAKDYTFDNDVIIGTALTSKKLFLNNVEITPSSGVGVSAGMLRALNLNLLVPTVAQTYDIIWSNLSPEEQLLWKGGDPTTSDPVQSATGNYWSFVKSAPSASKINWSLPIDLSSYTFEDLQSVWAIVRINNSTTINAEGQLWFQIQTNPPTGPNFYRTRWNYSNSATPINQFQYFYKIHALDTITTTNSANLGKGQEVGQTKFKGNPCDVEPNLWSIGFNKLVLSPTGDTTAGYTQAPILSVALNTASNIHTYSFDVVSIGINNIRYNLFFA